MKPLFCDTAHHRIIPPKFLFNVNIKTEKGITINCGVPKCKGKVKFKPEVKMETKEELIEKILKLQPSFHKQENPSIKKFGQYCCGIGEGWDWFDRNATYLDRVTGEAKKSFSETLRNPEFSFLQDASVEELQNTLEVLLREEKIMDHDDFLEKYCIEHNITKEEFIKTQRVERIAEFFGIGTTAIYNQLREETKLSNVHTKKAYKFMSEGLPYYDLNELLRLLCIELANYNLICRFTVCWSIDSDKLSQNLECVCNGKHYLTMMSGIEGVNSILNQIGFEKRLSQPKDFNILVVWKN